MIDAPKEVHYGILKTGEAGKSALSRRDQRNLVQQIKSYKGLHQKMTANKKALCLLKDGWVDAKTDTKESVLAMAATQELLEKEFLMAKNLLRNSLKGQSLTIIMSETFSLTTTVTSGVTNTVTCGGSATGRILASDFSEFSLLAGLFDEFRYENGWVEFVYANSMTINAGLTAGNSMPAIGYDPLTSGAANSTLEVSELQQHRFLDVCINGSTGGFPGTGASTGNKHKFEYFMPPGVMVDGNAGAVSGRQWQSTTAPAIGGYLHFYHVGSVVTAIVTGAGINRLVCQFRSRT